MSEKVMTLHPEGKSGVNLSKAKYDLIRDAIIDVVRENGEITFADLTTTVEENLGDSFDGSVPWYVTTIKLDLEARGVIERLPNVSPQRLRLVE